MTTFEVLLFKKPEHDMSKISKSNMGFYNIGTTILHAISDKARRMMSGEVDQEELDETHLVVHTIQIDGILDYEERREQIRKILTLFSSEKHLFLTQQELALFNEHKLHKFLHAGDVIRCTWEDNVEMWINKGPGWNRE